MMEQMSKYEDLLTVIKVGQFSFLWAFAKASIAGPGEEHALPPVS